MAVAALSTEAQQSPTLEVVVPVYNEAAVLSPSRGPRAIRLVHRRCAYW
jgi:hypothetical protein